MSDELHLVCNDCQELKYACRCGNVEAELENYRQKKVLKLCHEARELCKESPLAAPAGSAVLHLSDADAIEELYGEIEMYETSSAEADGVLRDKGAKRTILALARAIDRLRERDERRKADLSNNGAEAQLKES